MKYISTRGGGEPLEFCDILLGGLAPDGGLYLPESYPQVTDLPCRLARAFLRRSGIRDPFAFHHRHSAARPEGHLRQDLHGADILLESRRRKGEGHCSTYHAGAGFPPP
jgi:hypothetical protein